MMSFLRRKCIPNEFEKYFTHRKLPSTMSTEKIAADREIYDIFTSRLTGTASQHTDTHFETCSGHLVWKDLVDTFLAHSSARRIQLRGELQACTWQKDKDSLPQFFKKFNTLCIKLRSVKATLTDSELMENLAIILSREPSLKNHIDALKDVPNLDYCTFQTRILERVQSDKLSKAQGNRTGPRVYFSDAPTREPSTPHARPWQKRTSNFSNDGRPQPRPRQYNTPMRKATRRPWHEWKGEDKQTALAQLQADYQAQVAEVHRTFSAESPAPAPQQEQPVDNDGRIFDNGLAALADAADQQDARDFEEDETGVWCNVTVAHLHHYSADVLLNNVHAGTDYAKASDPTVDSGTTHHIFRHERAFDSITPAHIPITVAGGQTIYAEGRGPVTLPLQTKSGRAHYFTFRDALFVPRACRDLVATTQLEDEGHGLLLRRDDSALVLDNSVRIPLARDGRLRTIPVHRGALARTRAASTGTPRAPRDGLYHKRHRNPDVSGCALSAATTTNPPITGPGLAHGVFEPEPSVVVAGAPSFLRVQVPPHGNYQPAGTAHGIHDNGSSNGITPTKRARHSERTQRHPLPPYVTVLLAQALNTVMHPTDDEQAIALLSDSEQQQLAHRRAAHFSHNILRRTALRGLARGFTYSHRHPTFCDACPAGNSMYPHLGTPRSRASQPLELVHTDLWGKAQCPSLRGNRYAICFVDDYSRHIAIYFLKRKADAAGALRKFIDEYATPLRINIRTMQSDGGSEFLGEFRDVCRTHGIRQQFSAPEMQAQNSVAERTWRTIFSSSIRMLQDAQLPASYWEDAATAAAYVKNRIYSSSMDSIHDGKLTPFEALWSLKPDLSLLRVWGSPAYVHVPPGKHKGSDRKKKLDARARPAVFVGYTPNYKAWTFYDPQLKEFFISRAATFNERVSDPTPTLTLLKQPQPADLGIPQLLDDLTADSDDDHPMQPAPPPTGPALPLRSCTRAPPRATAPTPVTLAPAPALAPAPSTAPAPTPATAPVLDPAPARAKERTHNRAPVPADASSEGSSTSASDPAEGRTVGEAPETETVFQASPHDGMTTKSLARYFNVNHKSYHQWIKLFHPFGRNEPFDVGSIRKRNHTRFTKGTDVPVPIGNSSFIDTHTQRQATERRKTRHSSVKESTSIFMAFALTVTATYHTLLTPKNYGDVKKSKQNSEWHESMQDEYNSLIGLGTWELVPRKAGDKVIGSMWAYKIKENPDGSVSRFKSRLVARGDQQHKDSYAEIFAPVIKFVTLRILLAIACVLDWELHQVDIGNAYCNARVEEDGILMRQPPGFEQTGPDGEEMVCLLRKSLYGLKQAGRAWNNLLNSWLTSPKKGHDPRWLRFTRCRTDYSLYHYRHKGVTMIIGCYVDDLVIISNDLTAVNEFKALLGSRFKITDLKELKWILGMEVHRNRKARTLTLHQRKYVKDILDVFKMTDAHPSAYPAAPGVRLTKTDTAAPEAPKTNVTFYRSMVGKLVYLLVASEPSIAFAVGQLSRFFSCPNATHVVAAKLVFRYLKGMLPSQGLTYRGDKGFNLHAYCDSDWAGCPDTRRSTSGYVVMFAGAAVAWISKRQPTVALSSAEAEYATACLAAQEIQWIRQLLAEINIDQDKGATTVHSDSQSAMHMAGNPTAGRAKHMDIKYHFTKEAVERGVVSFKYVHTSEQLADALTKGLAGPKVIQFRNIYSGNTEDITVTTADAASASPTGLHPAN